LKISAFHNTPLPFPISKCILAFTYIVSNYLMTVSYNFYRNRIEEFGAPSYFLVSGFLTLSSIPGLLTILVLLRNQEVSWIVSVLLGILLGSLAGLFGLFITFGFKPNPLTIGSILMLPVLAAFTANSLRIGPEKA